MEAWSLLPASDSPSRASHLGFYDAQRDRLILYGGVDDVSVRGEVFAAPAAGPIQWTLLSSSNEWALAAAAGILDPVRDRLVIMGGTAGSNLNYLTLTFPLFGGGWTYHNLPTQPDPLAGNVAIWDPLQDRMIVMGGQVGVPWSERVSDRSWSLDLFRLDRWRLLNGPPRGPSLYGIFDQAGGRLVAYDGQGGDAHALIEGPIPNWINLLPIAAAPPPRLDPAVAYDAVHNRLLLFGGRADSYEYRNDLWALSLSGEKSWVELAPQGSGTPASVRDSPAMAYDELRDRLVIDRGLVTSLGICYYGQEWHYRDPSYVPDTWSFLLSSEGWSSFPASPEPRSQHFLFYDRRRDRLLTFGGHQKHCWCIAYDPPVYCEDTYYNDVQAISATGEEWQAITTSGTPPAPGTVRATIHDRSRDRLVIVTPGLQFRSLAFGDSNVWSPLSPIGTAPQGGLLFAAYDEERHRMMVYTDEGQTATLTFDEAPTPAEVGVMGVDTDSGIVRITWFSSLVEYSATAAVYRRGPQEDWVHLGDSRFNADGFLTFEDAHVSPATDYRYRLQIFDGSSNKIVGEVAVRTPAAAFSLAEVFPNPARGEIQCRISLSTSKSAGIELIDVSGRVRWKQTLTIASPGLYELQISPRIATGHYWLRLSQGGRVATRSLLWLR